MMADDMDRQQMIEESAFIVRLSRRWEGLLR